jgi:RNA polymerase sigma-70 factor (ECF subfamily)
MHGKTAPPSVASSEEMVPFIGVVRAVGAAMLRLAADHPDVDDCTSETLRRAVEGRGRLRAGEPIRPWILGIARHVALDMLRAQKRLAAVQERTPAEPPDDPAPPAVENVPDGAAGPEELLERAREHARMRQAILSLPDVMAKALMRFHLDGKSYQEIARELGVPLGTVATWVARGRQTLAERLGYRGRFE